MTLDTTSFDLHRSLPLTPDRLWQVLTEPTHRDKWGAPDPETVLVTERSDVRVGGEDRQRSGPADAPDFLIDTRWYDLAGPDRAVYTETLIFGGEAVCTSLVTYVLIPDGDNTKLSLTVAVSSFSGPEALDEVRQGWEGGLDNLERYASTVSAPH